MGKVIKWTDEEIQLLKEHYPNDSWDNILSFIHREKGNIITKASKLGIVRNSPNKKIEWSDEEVEILRGVYLTTRLEDIPRLHLPNKSKDAIIRKMGELRLLKSKPWTQEEIEKFIKLYPNTDNKELCKIFGRTKNAIINESQKLNLYKSNRFTEEDIAFIRNNYLKMSDFEIGEILGHHWRVVKDKRLSYGWKHSEPILGQGYKSIAEFCRKSTPGWRDESIAYCNHRCVITREEFDDVHHLYSANLIIKEVADIIPLEPNASPEMYDEEYLGEILDLFDKKQREYGHGVCLTKEIHTMFHKEYGFGNNTKEQFLDFVDKHSFKLLVDIT